MGWLHCLPYHSQQVVIEGVQVRLVLQFGGEAFQGLSSIVLPSVEAPVYKRLYAASQRREQCCYQEGGCHHCECGLLASKEDEDSLQHHDDTEVECDQCSGERAVDEGTVDKDVYLVEAVAQDSYPHRDRNARKTSQNKR